MKQSRSLLYAVLPLLASSHPTRFHSTSVISDPRLVCSRSFDYVIAGGGLTGLTVASRLSEHNNVSVLVIEGGQDNHNDPRVFDVRTYGQAFGSSDLDYNLSTTRVPWQNNQSLHMTAGKTLGGSGSINGASWTKGPRTQYDVLPYLTGDSSWGWEALNEYMLHTEHFNPPSSDLVAKGADFEPEYHGAYGRVQVSFAQGMFGNIQLPALSASQSVWTGLKHIADVASGIVNGVTIIPNMLQPDVSQNRSSPLTAYIEGEPQTRNNLVILTGHRVTRIIWKDVNNTLTADGVEFQASRNSSELSVHARREILLAAGSMQSPQILELSGVGDPAVLKKAGIPLRKSMPSVGRNLQEQTKNTITFSAKDGNFNGSGPSSAIAFPNVHQLLRNSSSTTYTSIMQSLPAYAASLEAAGKVTHANATLLILQKQISNLFNQSEAAAEIFFALDPTHGTVGVDAWNLIPLARGTIHVKTNNSFDEQEIEPSYFGHPLDLALQTAATMQSRDVFGTEPLASLIAKEITPGLDVVAQGSDANVWEEWVKKTFTSVWHPIATLSMMKEELGGAVDNRLRVYGIGKLRVIDASVLPIQFSAHLSSSLYGIAEKAAVMIKEDQHV